MMRFDKSNHSVVVTCSDCRGLFSAIANDLREAANISADHERNVHGVSIGKTQGYGILYQSTRRASKT
jgi:hypothetical protein